MVCHRREEGWGVRGQSDTDVGTAGTERPEPGLTGGETETAGRIWTLGRATAMTSNPRRAVVPRTLILAQARRARPMCSTVRVGDDMVSTEGEHKGKYTEEGSPNHPKTNKRYYLIGKEPAIMKWVTNSYIIVISHGKKHY